MSPRDLVYVGHMLDMAKKATNKTQGLSRGEYDADENLRLALTHLIQIIGEAARQVSREFSDRHPQIPSADIIGVRHKVVHNYLGLMKTSCGRSSRQTCRRWWLRSNQSSRRRLQSGTANEGWQ